jgi:hypothetical protein
MSKISTIGIFIIPKDLVSRMEDLFISHMNFMASKSHQSGDKKVRHIFSLIFKLHFYTTSRGFPLKKPISSAHEEDRTEIFILSEWYTKIVGLDDHWGKVNFSSFYIVCESLEQVYWTNVIGD